MKVTQKQIALEAGVAPNTVSVILSGQQNWSSDATKERVLQAAKRLGYQPNRAARGLRLGTYFTVALLIPDLLNPYYAGLARVLENRLGEHEYDLLIIESAANLERERENLIKMGNRQIDGMICSLMDPVGCRDLIKPHVKNGMPFILIGRSPQGLGVVSVRSDFSIGMAEALRHLQELGHEHVVFVSGLPEGQKEDGQRLRFFKQLLADNGFANDPRSFITCGHTICDARRAFAEYWEQTKPRERATAVIALNDLLAIGVMRGAIECGCRIPEDVSVVGMDNIEIGNHLPISMTSVALPCREIALAAAEQFLNLKSGQKPPSALRHQMFPTKLVVRESTGMSLRKSQKK